jgi:CRISPR/Cas system-associated endonuclease/helicase Cas3
MISEAENMLKELFPDIRVIQAHGRMSKNGAEANVESFAEGNYDVLLATTVIENGVDIPSVNTIIIQNSQAFGMSTLYQLRGRVGRSDKQAYAYFLHREESVTEQAMLRLQAISELSDLGSGFDVANRDLEIRGAGSLLGTEQSGVASKVGFDLYMRMLKKSIRQLRGLDLPTIPRTNVLLPRGQGSLEVKKKTKDGIVLANLFQIPEFYIPAETDRLKQETAARLAESTSTLVDLTNQWKEAYGPLPANLQAKLKTMHFHACTRRLGIDLVGLVENDNGSLDCVLRSPGLRPRHLSMIIPGLPKEVLTPGLSVVFPKRFSKKDIEIRIDGAKKYDFTTILEDPSVNDEDAENWDALDEEEIEAMKDISSAYDISSMNEVDLEYYPRFIVKDFGDGPKAVDKLLKVLLPSAKIVFERQEKDKEVAKQATQLRDKREEMKQKRKELDKLEIQRTYLR